jgi:uncharacterized membrane protein YdbT with pleckstrin-like domain
MSSYLEHTLSPDETLRYRAHLSWWPHFGWVALSVLLLPVGIGLIGLLVLWVIIRSTELAVTNKRILVKTGFISRNTIELNLSRIESIQVHQGLFGRMLDFGTIIISGAGNPQAPLDKIKDPLAFRREALAAQDALLNGQGVPPV